MYKTGEFLVLHTLPIIANTVVYIEFLFAYLFVFENAGD